MISPSSLFLQVLSDLPEARQTLVQEQEFPQEALDRLPPLLAGSLAENSFAIQSSLWLDRYLWPKFV